MKTEWMTLWMNLGTSMGQTGQLYNTEYGQKPCRHTSFDHLSMRTYYKRSKASQGTCFSPVNNGEVSKVFSGDDSNQSRRAQFHLH